jgi:hypothetical protein
MSEEEVSKELAKKNQEIYINKLLKDLDQNYENLKIVIENLIILFFKELDNRTYEISIECDNTLSRDEISNRIRKFFILLKDALFKDIDTNKTTLEGVVVNNDFMQYVNQLEMISSSLITNIQELYLKEADSLINDVSIGFDDFSKERLEKLIKEIIYNRFMEKLKSSIGNINLILINNYQENNNHLDHMNEKTAAITR